MAMGTSSLLKIFGFILWIIAAKINSQEECGHPIGSFSTGKIVGGYDVGYYKYPWYVALEREDVVFCGGTLVAKKFIVTAAHCFQPFFKAVDNGHMTYEQIFKPTFGIYNVCRHENTQKQFEVAKAYVHEKYRKQDPYFDIALIKLKQEAKGFQPCCLPDKALDSRTRPREGYVSGLGDQQWNSRIMTCTMHEARILIYSDDVCKKMLDSQGEEGRLLDHAFCAGYMEGGIDACQGDSGGPLIIADPSGHYNLLGITSFGFECAKPNTLGIYTDVTHYLGWLRDKMREGAPSTPPTTKATTSRPTSAPPNSGPPDDDEDEDYPGNEDEQQNPPSRPHNPVMIIINILKKHKMGRDGEKGVRSKEEIQSTHRFHHRKRKL